MKYLADIPYPDNEKHKLELLGKLFTDWHQHFANNASILDKHNQVADEMVFDGFYPYYFSQRKRILFIGRETLETARFNYLELLYESYRRTKRVGNQHLNTHKFHSRMIYIAYSIVNAEPVWQKIPYASEIGDTFGTDGGLSFAFMNISKLSNESGTWSADRELINTSCRLSTGARNFIEEEIAILEPHIVITMNLGNELDLLGKLSASIYESAAVNSCWLESKKHRSLLIDSWHFSAPRKKTIPDYYNPIHDAVSRFSKAISANS